MHKFLVKNQRIETLERDVIASDQIAFVNIKFIFDSNWKTLHKVVQFTQCDETYNRVLGNDGTSCLLPTELHAGTVKMSVFGYDTQGLRATTVPVTLHIRPSGFVGDDTPIPPTPDLYAQLLQKMEELIAGVESGADGKDGLDGKDGENGLSAYELAVQDGFEGTLTEWLSSLKGTDGKDGGHAEFRVFNGELQWRPVDAKGNDLYMWTHLITLQNLKGENGLSAYELAVQEGFDGTIAEWLLSLKGADGENGSDADVSELTVQISELAEKLQSLADSTKYDIQVQNEKILHLENLLILMESQLEKTATITLFRADSEALTTYGKSVALVVNDGYHMLADFAATYPNFCSATNNYALSYNQADFNWDAVITTILLTEVALTANSKIAIRYQSGAAEDGKMYLVAKPTEIPDVPIGLYIYNQIKESNAISLNFKWLYADSDVTTLTSCDSITNGSYYLAFVGRSNNTHPLVKAIQVLGG